MKKQDRLGFSRRIFMQGVVSVWGMVWSLTILGGVNFASAANPVPLAGYWNTDLSGATGGTMMLMAITTEPGYALELGFQGQPVGAMLVDDGTNGDWVAGDGISTISLDLGASPEASFPLEILGTSSTGRPALSWPYLEVSAGSVATPTPQPITFPTVPPGTRECHPLSVGQCIVPWPSSYHLVPDGGTATGFRVAVPSDGLPGDNTPERLNMMDGFSPTSALIGGFPGKLQRITWPDFDEPELTLEPDSHFLVFNADDRSPNYGEQVAVHVEYYQSGSNSVVYMIPSQPLDTGTRYVVALRGLNDLQGNRITTTAEFAALRDGVASTPEVEQLRAVYDDIFTFLQTQGLTRAEIDLAWDFVTASQFAITSPLASMVDQALSQVDPATTSWTIDRTQNVSGGGKYYECTIQGPNFVGPNDRFVISGRDFVPQYQGLKGFPLKIFVPNGPITQGPAPGCFFGHGIFGDGSQVANAYIDELGMVGFGVDLKGFTSADVIAIGFQVIPKPVTEIGYMTDNLMQAVVNTAVIGKMLPAIATRLEAELGRPVLDPSRYYCVGQSLGGIMAGVMMGVDPYFQAGNLIVPGGAWSHLLQKSGIWSTGLGPITIENYFNGFYPDAIERQVVVACIQGAIDWVDPVNFSRHWSKEPLPGRQARYILIQQGVPDTTIPNFSTNQVIRGSGLPLLEPAAQAPFGFDVVTPPTLGTVWGGMTQFPGADHAAGGEPEAIDQRMAFFRSFFDPAYGPPGNIINPFAAP